MKMSKYIDKGVLLERMNRTRPYEGENGSFERHRRLQWLADIGQVNMCPTADIPRWIPVTERLPEEYGKYLVTVDLDYYVAVITLYYGRIHRKDVFYDDSEYGGIQWDGVIAWMPLPEPYKGGDTE